MDQIQHLAMVSVARACGFAGLGIMTVMIGLCYDPYLCAKSGAILVSLLAVVLHYRAMRAHRLDYRHSEVWIMLDADDMPPKAYAARLVRSAYHAAFIRFGGYAMTIALLLWAIAFVLWLTA